MEIRQTRMCGGGGVVGGAIVVFVLWAAFWIAVGYVAFHFIAKFW